MVTELDHALDDPGRVAHDRVARLARRGIERVDDVRLDLDDRVGKLKVLGEFNEVLALRAVGLRSVGVGRGHGEGAAEEDRGAAVVDEDDAPEADAELGLFLGELGCGLVGGHLDGGVVVQTQLDGETNESADETPEGAALTLGSISSEI